MGKNQKGEYSFYCTNYVYTTKYGENTTDYCPKCGAKMY